MAIVLRTAFYEAADVVSGCALELARGRPGGPWHSGMGCASYADTTVTSKAAKERPMPEVPASHADLLEKPLFAHLATIRPNGAPQSSVMWFAWDGSRIRLTHTSTRQKFANLAHESRVALSIADPDDQYRFLEVRGTVEKIEDDPGAEFYRSLQRRYGMDYPILDADVRVVITIRPDRYIAVRSGAVVGVEI
jgi:PPOX class probable F420-dependent enzyme